MRPRATDRQRGAALFIVLVLAALLTDLAGAVIRDGLSGVRAARVFSDVARADELGRAAVDIVTHQLSVGDAAARRGGSLGVTLADAAIAIDFLSESARVDVNAAPVPLIASLLSAAGAEPEQVASITEKIVESRAAPGAQPASNQPGTGPPGAGPPEAGSIFAPQADLSTTPSLSAQHAPAIQSTLEVTRAWGLPEALARRVLPLLTVANGSPKVDPVLADRLIVSAFMGGDETRTDDYLERRTQGFATTDSALLLLPETVRGWADFTDVPAVHAVARVTVAHRFTRRYDFVLAPSPAEGQGPLVLSWQSVVGSDPR